jgi:hypothetical protein
MNESKKYSIKNYGRRESLIYHSTSQELMKEVVLNSDECSYIRKMAVQRLYDRDFLEDVLKNKRKENLSDWWLASIHASDFIEDHLNKITNTSEFIMQD